MLWGDAFSAPQKLCQLQSRKNHVQFHGLQASGVQFKRHTLKIGINLLHTMLAGQTKTLDIDMSVRAMSALQPFRPRLLLWPMMRRNGAATRATSWQFMPTLLKPPSVSVLRLGKRNQ